MSLNAELQKYVGTLKMEAAKFFETLVPSNKLHGVTCHLYLLKEFISIPILLFNCGLILMFILGLCIVWMGGGNAEISEAAYT
jgi:hypothetical protein